MSDDDDNDDDDDDDEAVVRLRLIWFISAGGQRLRGGPDSVNNDGESENGRFDGAVT